MKKTITYTDLISGHEMTEGEMLDTVRACPHFSDPDGDSVMTSEGVSYTGRDLCRMAGVSLITDEDV